MLDADPGFPLTIRADITVGHHAILHGCTVGSNTLIGMRTTILNGARTGANCLIGANALVTEGKESMATPSSRVRQPKLCARWKRPEGATCEALLDLLKESEDLLKDTAGAGPVQDAGLIAHAQAVLHNAITRYGALVVWGTEVGQRHAADVLRQMLEASKRASETFNEVAMQRINKAAAGPA